MSGLTRHWREYAACRNADPNLFFPEVGASTRAAREICANCVVSNDCLEFALAATNPVTAWGIWGGKTERQLRAIRQERTRAQREYDFDQARRNGELGGCVCGAPDVPEATSKYFQRHKLGIMGVPESPPCENAWACRRLTHNAHAKRARERKRRKGAT